MTQTFLRDRQQDDATTAQQGMLWNTGNYFFMDAVERQLDLDDVVYVVGAGTGRPTKEVEVGRPSAEADTLILSMSNFISPGTDMTAFADYIERVDFDRVVMIGAGAQAPTFDEPPVLRDGTLRFIRAISDRCASIGVRGEYTAWVLEKYGFNNAEVIGCPTLFWSGSREFTVDGPPEQIRTIAANFTPNGGYRDVLSLFLKRAVEAGAQYIAQDENYVSVIGPSAQEALEFTSKYYGAFFQDDTVLREWLKAERHYYSVSEWIDAMRAFDFTAGTRFHGNMAAIQAGRVALNIVHDSRTKELCDYMNLPYLALSKYDGRPLAELAEFADYSLFNATYRDRFENYVSFLDTNDVRHRLALPEGDLGWFDGSVTYATRADERFEREVARIGSNSAAADRLRSQRHAELREATVRDSVSRRVPANGVAWTFSGDDAGKDGASRAVRHSGLRWRGYARWKARQIAGLLRRRPR